MVNVFSSFLKDLRKHLILSYEIYKFLNDFSLISIDWRMSKSYLSNQRTADYILVHHTLTANDKFKLENDTSKTYARAAWFQFQQGKWVGTDFYS